MLSFLLKAVFALTSTIFVGNGNSEPVAETSNNNIKSTVTSESASTTKKDSTTTQTPIVVFKLINTSVEPANKAEGKRSVKISNMIGKFNLLNNPQTDRRRSTKAKVG